MPQRDSESCERDGGESRKKYIDGARLNPKRCKQWEISSQALKGEGSETIPNGSRAQAIGARSGRRPV